MAKYNYSRVSLARKKELETPDEFITFSSQLLAFGLKYRLYVSIGFGVFLALVILYVGGRFYTKITEDKAFALREQVIKTYNSAAEDMDAEKAYERVAEDFESILEKYPRTTAGKLARVNYANICFATGRYDRAIELYRKGAGDFNENPPFRNLILSSLGHCYEAKKDNASAVLYFEMIVSGRNGMLKDEALFSLGRIYREMGDNLKSNEAYQRVVSDHPGSIYVDMAKEKITG